MLELLLGFLEEADGDWLGVVESVVIIGIVIEMNIRLLDDTFGAALARRGDFQLVL